MRLQCSLDNARGYVDRVGNLATATLKYPYRRGEQRIKGPRVAAASCAIAHGVQLERAWEEAWASNFESSQHHPSLRY